MQKIRAAKRYAKALLEYAVEKQQADEVFHKMTTLLGVMNENIEFQRLLLSPIVKSSVKRNVLLQLFPDKTDLIQQLIEVLVKNKRLSLTKAIAKAYIVLYQQYKEKLIAIVTTAQPLSTELSEQVLQKVKQIIGNNNIELKNKIDPNIIGGFILRVGDLQYNASISHKISTIQRNFKDKLYVN